MHKCSLFLLATRALNEGKGEKKMETVNQEVVKNDTTIEKSEERTFTQAELDKIVGINV